MSALAKLSLLSLFFIGGGTIHGLSIASGYYDLVEKYKAKGILHDGTRYDPQVTGVQGLDDFLGTLIQFFWPCSDGTSPGTSLQSLLFVTQFVPFLVIWVVEGSRSGNKGKAVSFATVYALLAQVGGLALVSPLYLLLYVSTSPTVSNPSPANLAVDPAWISGIPISWLVGSAVPTVFLALPAPAVISIATKVKALVLWQPFPLYMTTVLYLWRTLFAGPRSNTSAAAQLKSLRGAYKFALGIAVPAHAAVWGISIAAAAFPQLFASSVAQQFHPLAAIIPANPLMVATSSVSSMAQGAQNFLQWDYFVSSASYLVFALNARFNTKVEPCGFSAAAAAGLGARIAVLGPLGAALSYLWERDEIILGKEEAQKKLR